MAILEAGSSSLSIAAYGSVSPSTPAYTGLYGRLGRFAGLAVACAAVAGLIIAVSSSGSSPNSLIAKAPGPGVLGVRMQRDVNGILEGTISGDPDLDDAYEQSEKKLLGNIEEKLKRHVQLDVDSEVQNRLAAIKKKDAEEKLESLVDRISTEMSSVTTGLKNIEILKEKHRDTIKGIHELEKEVSAQASRDLFLRAAAWLVPSNETACNTTECGNQAIGNATSAEEEGDKAEEVVSKTIANPSGASANPSGARLRIKSKRSQVWKKKEDSTIQRMKMTSIQVARLQQQQEGALKRLMARYQNEVKAESKAK